MFSRALILAAVIAYVEARFGQEQIPIAAISAVTSGGQPGQAATIAGAAVSDILGAANSCAKLQRADQVIQELGTGDDAIKAAIGLVTAEKNTNPFANNNVQNVCNDPTLPASEQLRGITPLIDPAVDTDGAVAALSKQTAASPLDATGKSVFDLLTDAGFGDLVAGQAAAGNAAAGGNAGASSAAAGNGGAAATSADAGAASATTAAAAATDDCADVAATSAAAAQAAATSAAAAKKGKKAKGNKNGNAGAASATAAAAQAAATDDCAGADTAASATAAAAGSASTAAAASNNATTGATGATGQSSIAGADFGKCTPTIIFEGGLGGRPATEFTFQIADTVARGGQQEALNPNIITNALCNQLTNVCDANDAAKAACEDGKQKVAALGTRDKNTADTFNAAVGFAGAVTNPDGGPAEPAASAAAGARRSMRFRA